MAYDDGSNQPLPAAVLAALHAGDKIDAIKLLREHNHLGLKQAKDLIDAYQHGQPIHSRASMSNALPPTVIEAMQRGRKIEAIRLLREVSGMGLKEAKEAVEALGPHDSSSVVQNAGDNKLIWLALVAVAGFIAYQWLN